MQFNFNDYLNYSGVKNADASTFPTIIKGVFGYVKDVHAIDLTIDTNVNDTLKLAVYRHIDAVYFALQNKTDSIDKTVNAAGNTTYFSKSVVPEASEQVYCFFTKRQLVLV